MGPYANGWNCDKCKAKGAVDERRWHCNLCVPTEDYCFICTGVGNNPTKDAHDMLVEAIQEQNRRLGEQLAAAEKEKTAMAQALNDFRCLMPHVQRWVFRAPAANSLSSWNIRSAPSLEAAVVGSIQQQEAFLVEEEQASTGWLRVCSRGQRGYCIKHHNGQQYLHQC
jgi:hypothetical protein